MALLNKLLRNKTGSILVEVVVAVGLTAVLIPSIINGLITSYQGEPQQAQRLKALALAKESYETIRIVREAGWDAFAINGTYHLVRSGQSWELASGIENIDGFNRSVVIEDAYRDSEGNMAESGTMDPSVKKVTITVGWTTPLTSQVEFPIYMTRYLDNLSYLETTVADFSAGEHVGTTVVDTYGGEVLLGSGGRVDWCKPRLTIAPLDLPGQAYANDISAVEGMAFVATGGNASGNSLNKIGLTSDYPPVAINEGAYDYKKSYALFTTQDYVFATSDFPGMSVEIVNDQTLTKAGYFNPTGGGKGLSVYISNGIGYMTVSNKLFSFDASTITGGNQPQLGYVGLVGTGVRLMVKDNYVYVAISGATEKLQVISSTNGGRNLKVVGSANLNSQSAKAVAINDTGTRAYVITGTSSSQKEVFVVDTSSKSENPSSPVNFPVVSNYDTNGMNPNDVVVVPGNKMIVVGSGGEQYQVVDIANELNPVKCGGLTNPNGASIIYGIDTVVEADYDSYSYILTNDMWGEFQMIEGGPGGAVSFNGTFTSQIFSAGRETAFNRYDADIDLPLNTQIRYQFAVANPVSGDCQTADYEFIGPDGSGSTYFTEDSGAVPLLTGGGGYQNPGSCLRYRVNISSTDLSQSPVFNGIYINYSP